MPTVRERKNRKDFELIQLPDGTVFFPQLERFLFIGRLLSDLLTEFYLRKYLRIDLFYLFRSGNDLNGDFELQRFRCHA